jgi:serralysin
MSSINALGLFDLPPSLNSPGLFDGEPPTSTNTVLPPRSNAFGSPTSTTTTTATGDNNIDGLLSGVRWASNSISFSFTDSFSDYESGYANASSHSASFQTLNTTQRNVAREWLTRNYYNISLLSPVELTGASDRDATIRIAMSDNPGTAYAYYPNGSFVEGGDAWFNRVYYNSPVIGNYAYHTFGHEFGHALGLKHGQELGGVSNVAMNSDRDSMEFSIMTYRSYVGHDLNALPYYTNETWGYAQSLMMYDIRAIQQMYGAWFGYNSGNTNYTFSTTTGEMFVDGVGQGTPGANRIFRTVWDGDGIDTYDFSNYVTNLSINLAPGGWSDLDVGGNFQRAALNAGFGGIYSYARGHVFNALQYNGDIRSLIENAVGGLGNDSIVGNIANNTIYGGGGNDTVDGGDGNDIIYFGDGNDSLNSTSLGDDIFFGGNGDDYIYGYIGNESYYGEEGNDTLLGDSGNDLLDGGVDDDSINGGSGADIIQGGLGADFLDGGADTDYLSYANSSAAVIVNLSANTASGGDATGDIIVVNTFENLTGSSYDDNLLGNGGNNIINAGLGNDTVNGGNGNDRINGQTGNDSLLGSAGNDTLTGSSGNDILNGGIGKDFLAGGTSADRFVFSNLSHSLLAAYDVITDYTTGERIYAANSVIPIILEASSGNAASLAGAAISTVLTTGVFTSNSAKAFTVTGYGGSTFLAFNDGIDGFNAANDSIVQLQNYTLGAVTII